jgi:hypothetical protein
VDSVRGVTRSLFFDSLFKIPTATRVFYWGEPFMLLFHIVMAVISGLLSMGWIAIIIIWSKSSGRHSR